MWGVFNLLFQVLTNDGAVRTNLEWIADFGLWQDPFAKSPIFVNYFDGDILFELLSILSIAHKIFEMQGMDKNYDGHAWCKLVTTNIKHLFGLSFKKACCSGHLLLQP